MSFPCINPTTTQAWRDLENHFSENKDLKMQDLFAANGSRSEKLSIQWQDFYIDYSKNRITEKTLHLLLQLAEETQLKQAIDLQFSGAKINKTENRAVLHTALRDFNTMPQEVKDTLLQMQLFSEKVISGKWKGYTGKPITDVVNIGIGGSDLGPNMVVEALSYYKNHLNLHFISNVDGDHLQEILKKVSRKTTLFIIVSKTFTTQETLTNATTIRKWFLENAKEEDIKNHFVAVSTNVTEVANFGIAQENTFTMWDWVGGRFSLWSAVGLSICCAVGYTNFENLLKGAHQMDIHFKETPFKENMPVVLALLSVWYANFYNAETEAILPYNQYLSKLVPYLQQGIMESNGKSVDRNGNPINYQTGTIIWGSTGTNAQHAFFQLLHQGTKLVPTDFIAFAKALHLQDQHHDMLLANCFAQTEALLNGTWGKKPENLYQAFSGNKPSTTIVIEKLTPQSLGKLIALYEHKLFVQGVLWNIFSYDQWGVELGKNVAKNTLKAVQNTTPETLHPSTDALLKITKAFRKR